MSRNNNNNPSTKDQGKDDFEDYFLDDSDLLAIDVDADHLCKQSSSANNCSFPSNNTIINTPYDSSTAALTKQQNIYSSLSTATPMTTGTTMDRSFSPSMNTYNSKRFKVEEGPLVNNNRSKNNKDERDTTTTTAVIPSQQLQLFEQKMTKTLFKHFGYDKFRKGQLDVLYAIIEQRRDCAVFWATGSGKSLCYQLPALHFYYNNTKNCNAKKMVAVVISPLVSLMQDQCNKLNGMFSPTTVAVYLGSSQRDKSMDHRALIDGEFPLVFLTPEKLCSGNVLDQIERLPLSVIAIDEAHCVSEWGHDFRKEYRQLCIIRNRRMLSDVPILTLTGTATPRVREDIISSLLLKDPLIQIHSNDRDNLRLEVHRKPTNGGFKTALQQSLIRDLNPRGDGAESTIIYAPTIKAVEDISQWLSIQLPKLRIMPYHSKLTEDQREAAHVGFLVGSVSVVVATVSSNYTCAYNIYIHIFYCAALIFVYQTLHSFLC
jgi:ATP-dependent DNA helicase RecQ